MRRGGAVLVTALVVDSVGSGLFAPLSLVYFTRLTDVSLALVGVLLTVANLVALPVPVVAGAWADRIGPRPLVVGAQVLVAAGFVAYAGVSELLADHADAQPGGRGVDGWYAIANAARTAGLAIGGRAPHRARAADEPAGYRDLVRDRPFLGLVGLNTGYAMTSMMLALALPTVVLTGGGPAWLAAALLAANALLITLVSAPVVRRLGPVCGAPAAWPALRCSGRCGAGRSRWSACSGRWPPPSCWSSAPSCSPWPRRCTPRRPPRSPPAPPRRLAAASVLAPAFFGGLYAAGHALPFVVLGAVNLLSLLALARLERALPPAALLAR